MYIRYSLSVCEKKGLVLCVYRPGGGGFIDVVWLCVYRERVKICAVVKCDRG